MGEGLMKKMFQEIYSPSRAEEAEDLGEYSDSGGGDSDAPTPRNNLPMTPSSKSPLYDFSYLFEQIPIRKGLSQYYLGKSQSFTSLLEVKSLEELPKKEIRCSTRKMKPCKSYAALDKAQELSISSESCSKSIPKKIPPSIATSCASSVSRTGSGSFLSRGGRPPPIQVHKHHQ